jgi:hypothetical protein
MYRFQSDNTNHILLWNVFWYGFGVFSDYSRGKVVRDRIPNKKLETAV